MSDTNFITQVTVIPADWLNDVNAMRYTWFGATGALVNIGDTSNSNMTLGLNINQGAADNQIIAFKSSDVAHGMTSVAETDTFGYMIKAGATTGGLEVNGLSSGTGAVTLVAAHSTDDTTKSTAGRGTFRVSSVLKSGTTVGVNGANANMVSFDTNGTTRFILDADGDSHQDVGTAWTNYDAHNDVALLNATSALLGPDTIKGEFTEGFLVEHKAKLTELGIVSFNDDGHHFINWSRFQMLHMGATRWLAQRMSDLESRVAAIENADK